MSYFSKTARVPRFSRMFIGPVPETIDEVKEIVEKIDTVIDLRAHILNVTDEAEKDGVSWSAEKALIEEADKAYHFYPVPTYDVVKQYDKAIIGAIRGATDKAINALNSAKTVLIHAGRRSDNFTREGMIVLLVLCISFNIPVSTALDMISRSIPAISLRSENLDVVKIMRNEKKA